MAIADPPVPRHERTAGPTSPRTTSWWAHGMLNIGVTLLLSVVAWWLLIDPSWSATSLYPQPFSALLFWTVMGTVWVAFTFGWVGPARLAQPLRGLIAVATTLVIGAGVTLLITRGWGSIDPSFAANREGGLGYLSAGLIVLFAFFFYVSSAVNAGQWPWGAKLSQPLTGLGDLVLMLVPTLLAYAVFMLPSLATWSDPGDAPFALPTTIGWFYSLVVAVVLTGPLAGNLPWSLARRPGAVAVLGFVGNIALGSVLYFLLRGAAELLMGSGNASALGVGLGSHAAELGVCWVLWMLAWANVFGNKPTGFGVLANICVRAVVTFLLGAVTYVAYYFFVAEHILHEPAVVGSMHGDALGFIDWVILWMLWYVLFFGSKGIPAMAEDEN